MQSESNMPKDPDDAGVEFFYDDAVDEDGNVYPVKVHSVTSSLGPVTVAKAPRDEFMDEHGRPIDPFEDE